MSIGGIIAARRRLIVPGGAGPLIAIGGASAAAAGFTVNPTTLGAQDGDLMVVSSIWETDTAVASPAGWTEVIDEGGGFGGALARWHLAKRIFSGSPPGDQSWSYGGSNNVAWQWAILRGVSDLGTVTKITAKLSGTYSIDVTIGAEGALVWIGYDGSSQDPTAVADMTNIDINGRSEDLSGMYGELAWITANATVVADPNPFNAGLGRPWWVPVN